MVKKLSLAMRVLAVVVLGLIALDVLDDMLLGGRWPGPPSPLYGLLGTALTGLLYAREREMEREATESGAAALHEEVDDLIDDDAELAARVVALEQRCSAESDEPCPFVKRLATRYNVLTLRDGAVAELIELAVPRTDERAAGLWQRYRDLVARSAEMSEVG